MKASIDYRLVVMILHEMGNLYGDSGVNVHEMSRRRLLEQGCEQKVYYSSYHFLLVLSPIK